MRAADVTVKRFSRRRACTAIVCAHAHARRAPDQNRMRRAHFRRVHRMRVRYCGRPHYRGVRAWQRAPLRRSNAHLHLTAAKVYRGTRIVSNMARGRRADSACVYRVGRRRHGCWCGNSDNAARWRGIAAFLCTFPASASGGCGAAAAFRRAYGAVAQRSSQTPLQGKHSAPRASNGTHGAPLAPRIAINVAGGCAAFLAAAKPGKINARRTTSQHNASLAPRSSRLRAHLSSPQRHRAPLCASMASRISGRYGTMALAAREQNGFGKSAGFAVRLIIDGCMRLSSTGKQHNAMDIMAGATTLWHGAPAGARVPASPGFPLSFMRNALLTTRVLSPRQHRCCRASIFSLRRMRAHIKLSHGHRARSRLARAWRSGVTGSARAWIVIIVCGSVGKTSLAMAGNGRRLV